MSRDGHRAAALAIGECQVRAADDRTGQRELVAVGVDGAAAGFVEAVGVSVIAACLQGAAVEGHRSGAERRYAVRVGARIQARQIQQVINQGNFAIALVIENPKVALGRVAGLIEPVLLLEQNLQKLNGHLDIGHGGPQLVGDRAQKVVLELVEPLQLPHLGLGFLKQAGLPNGNGALVGNLGHKAHL